jgi:integration host factor subunit beta
MTKSQLIEAVAARAAHLTRRDIERVVNQMFDLMVGALREKRRIEIRGFGSFAVRVRSPRHARNPKTGQAVIVPVRRTPFFTAGKELRERLNDPAPLAEQEPTASQAKAAPLAERSLTG